MLNITKIVLKTICNMYYDYELTACLNIHSLKSILYILILYIYLLNIYEYMRGTNIVYYMYLS